MRKQEVQIYCDPKLGAMQAEHYKELYVFSGAEKGYLNGIEQSA
jgi:hypothetical protein